MGTDGRVHVGDTSRCACIWISTAELAIFDASSGPVHSPFVGLDRKVVNKSNVRLEMRLRCPQQLHRIIVTCFMTLEFALCIIVYSLKLLCQFQRLPLCLLSRPSISWPPILLHHHDGRHALERPAMRPDMH